MDVNTFAKQLLALRAQSIATVAAIDAIIAQFDEEAKTAEPMNTPPEAGQPSSSEECDHPPHLRVSASTMGHPTRYVCRKCNTMQEE